MTELDHLIHIGFIMISKFLFSSKVCGIKGGWVTKMRMAFQKQAMPASHAVYFVF
jgi:hypothetical protein